MVLSLPFGESGLSALEGFSTTAELVLAFSILVVFAFTLNKPFLYVIHDEVSSMEALSDYDAKIMEAASSCRLTPREREIFELLAYGRNSHYIESALSISPNTVKTHLRNIYNKMGVSNQQELLSKVSSTRVDR